MTDQEYMQIALKLAQKGCGFVNPNPMVGAIIVKDDMIIGQGYHEVHGGSHAERNALRDCTEPAEGATLYVTLEPCCHYGKTPPCTEAILESKIRKVVIGAYDPNPLISGKGIKILKQNGVKVTCGVLKKECEMQNEIFFHFIKTKTPFVALKYAMTLDGKIATRTGESKWITGEEARKHAHALRNRYSAILVGASTVMMDDPMLNCRLPDTRDPVRIVCDTNLRIPIDSKIVQTAKDIPTYVASACEDADKIRAFEALGCRVLQIPKEDGHVSFEHLIKALAQMKIDSVLVEGGAQIHFSALKSGFVKKVYAYIAPKILGGSEAMTPVGGFGAEKISEAFRLKNRIVHFPGEDILLEYDMEEKDVYGNH